MEEYILDSGIKGNRMDMVHLLKMELLSMDNGIWAKEYDGSKEKKQKQWKNSII